MAILFSNLFWNVLLLIILAEWIRRAVWLYFLRRSHPPLAPEPFGAAEAPKVSIIVPAKNEETNIQKCLDYLTRQEYPNFEIIVVDDRSTDRTPEILDAYRQKFPVRMVRIEKLPPGWTGKNHAMTAGSKAAAGEWILFTDADTTHGPFSLSSAMKKALADSIDFLTLSPETESRSFWEKTVQPLAASSLAFWFNPAKVNDDRNPAALANGQFILVKKSVYQRSGGNESVKTEVVEDVALARRLRTGGHRVQFLNGSRLYSTRMYTSLHEIVTGWTRILTYLFNKNIRSILCRLFLFVIFSILPFAVFVAQAARVAADPALPDLGLLLLSVAVCGLIIAMRFVGNRLVQTNPWFGFLHPMGSLVMCWILCACLYRIVFRRPSAWKGDQYR